MKIAFNLISRDIIVNNVLNLIKKFKRLFIDNNLLRLKIK